MTRMTPAIPIERFEVFATGLDHPECVAFDREGNLWAGGEAGQVYRINPQGDVQLIATLGGFTGGIACSPGGEIFVCNPSLGIVRVDASGKHEVFATHAGERKLICPNYPVFNRGGDLFVSDSGQWKRRNGALVQFKTGGAGEVVADGLGYANGLALSNGEQTLFMIESDTDRVFRFDMSRNSPPAAACLFAENVGRLPDGLALDEAGNLYASCYASDDIQRIGPTGEVELFAYDHHAVLLSRPTNMAFGVRPDDRDTMYVANLGRYTIVRAKVGVRGQLLASHSKA